MYWLKGEFFKADSVFCIKILLCVDNMALFDLMQIHLSFP